MQELEFAELDEGGRLVVVAEDGTRYAVPVDDRLRAALRRRPQAGTAAGAASGAATPREVQAMIRAGQTAEEVAAATGWELERVRRFEGPVLAEREHVVGLAKAAHVRAQGRTDGSHTLERRVRERLQSRGVPPADTRWDAARTGSQGPWTVVVAFSAGGRERQAAWHYEVQDRSIEALDDEARWLSEDEQALPGGLAGHPLLGGSHAEDETADLMATMRQRRQARGRRARRPEPGRAEERGRDSAGIDNEPLPLEDLSYDPEAMGEPPAAHPRGSAPESPAPVQAVEGGPVPEQAAGEPQDRPTAAGTPKAQRERRRLRIPKLPPVPGDPADDEGSGVGDEEICYARTHDPQEVSFEEFFGTEDDGVEVAGDDDRDDDLAAGQDELAADEPAADELVADELVADDEQIPVANDQQVTAVAREDGSVGLADEAADEDEPDLAHLDPDGTAGSGTSEAPDVPDVTRRARTSGTDRDGEGGRVNRDDDGLESADSAAAGRRKGRTSVPSWDDIMFGGGDRRRG